MDVQEFNKILEEFDFEDILNKTYKETEQSILSLNKEQLRLGINAKGGKMPDYKSKAYAEMKERMGSKSLGRWDLFLTKKFQNRFKEIITKTEIEITSDDSKKAKIEKKLDKNLIFGLTEENLEAYIWDVFYKQLLKKIRHGINL